MTRFLAISPQSQFWLFHFALALNILGMVLTDMWLPMVVGAIVTTYLSIDALVRVRYVLPMKKEMRELRHELERLRKVEQQYYDE
ncbi:hypothetical protein [Photobacterium damselae]|uniref:hypothetical protein n=2 Tax=Photobacterium damselae TaxID=38293 RepID=UPI0010FE0026|nr:hypothetical protein [Photobacterium damselae]KAB1512695.1 hypothetical protein FD717_009895 [Photobacterium damselae subsp. damselae]TLS76265.1 hypothetical protein FD721_13725 [Photobacterium damselae subsp. damselae]TLS88766.1 hypothetical protein FD720_04245 [Photobacterium damselae subsp. damselae]